MKGKRKAALARLKRVVARAQARQAIEAAAPSPTPVVEAAPTPIERRMIDRWVASRIVNWPSINCFGCKLPIVVGAKWVDLVCDDNRARFHSDCEPAWRTQQEVAARRALGLDRSERE
jgi:hypothetical protein